MAWDDVPQIVGRLSEYLSSFDWNSAESLCMQLIARLDNAQQPFPASDAKEILARLRRKRRFRLMGLMADALIRSGQASPPHHPCRIVEERARHLPPRRPVRRLTLRLLHARDRVPLQRESPARR